MSKIGEPVREIVVEPEEVSPPTELPTEEPAKEVPVEVPA